MGHRSGGFNLLNQYTQRTVPRRIDLLGSAHTGAVVTVKSVVATGAPPAYTRAVRQKDYFHAEVPVSTNGAAQVEFDIFAVLGNAGSNGQDAVSTEIGSKFIAPTPETFTYDADGNLVRDGRFSYLWDGENRLVMASNATTQIAFAYDPMGRRIGKTVVGGSAAAFVYDGWNLIREVTTQGGSAATNAYMWGLDLSQSIQGAGGVGGLLAVIQNGEPYFACADGNGNVTDYVDTNGTVVAHREYDPFGGTIALTGTKKDDFNFWFSTRYTDGETGLVMYPFRPYSPTLGRFLSRDPIGEAGGENVYAFVLNDPVSLIDPLGLEWTVTRNYESQADAKCDCDDTVDALAKEIKLDPAEFTKWLTATDGKPLPSSSGEKIKAARQFKIPNEAHITQGNLDPGIFPVYWDTKIRKDDYVDKYKKKKYAVKDHFTAGEAGNGLGDINGSLGAKGIAIWAHFGHGEIGTGKLFIGKPATAYGPASFKPHHKLSEVVLFSCFAGQNKTGWKALVAPGGSLFSSDKAINPSWMGWWWVSEDVNK